MAISPGRYNFTGGAFLGGDGTDLKRGDIKKFTLVCPRYNEETGVYEYDPLYGKDLYSRFLVLRRKGQVIASYQPITGTNPQAVEFDLPDSEQFVLRHSSMSAPFTNEEFTQCYDEMVAGHTVVVQYSSFGLAEAQLVRIDSTGALVFARCQGDMITTYTVSQNQPHNITIASNIIQDPDAKLNVTLGGVTKIYTPTGADLSVDIDAEISRVYIAKGSASVATLNGGIAGIQNGWCYVLTNSGTLTDGNISVVAGDNVAWDGSAWFKVGNQVTPNVLFLVQTPEYVLAITDSKGVLLLAIRKDGSVDWAKGIPAPIKAEFDQVIGRINTLDGTVAALAQICSHIHITSNEEFVYAIADENDTFLFGITKDGSVNWSKGLPSWLESRLHALESAVPNKVDKVVGKSLIDSVFASGVSVVSNEEFIMAVMDSDGAFLFGIKKDGTFDWAKGIPNVLQIALSRLQANVDGKVDKVVGKSLIDDQFASHTDSTPVDPEWFWALVDTDGRLVEGITQEGIHAFKTPVRFDGGINWSDDNLNDLVKALKDIGFTGGAGDWSDSESLEIPIPGMAVINFTNISQMPQTKTTDAHAIMEFWDMNGNYFKKKVIANAQGSSSLSAPKKNISIDLCNDEWVGDDTFKIKFGGWVPQDSFHIKAYYTDFFRCVGLSGYDLVKKILDTRVPNTTWKKALNYGTDPVGQKNVSPQIDSGALCYPQGFLCKVYLNGVFEGLFCWQLKKHRDNYNMNKKTAKNIHIEGMLGGAFFGGTIDWTAFEIRNPKDLITYSGTKYDGDNPTELIDSTSPAYNPSNSKHVLSAKVKRYIIDLSNRMAQIGNDPSIFEQYFDVDSCVDYAILSDTLYNYDYVKNVQWTTWDGVKWFVNPYDLDCTLGANSAGDGIHYPTTSHVITASNYPITFAVNHYTSELEQRWKELRDAHIIDARLITENLEHYVRLFGKDGYKAEYDKWTNAPCNRDPVFDTDNWDLERDADGNPVIYTAQYHDWNGTQTYAPGYVVQYNLTGSSIGNFGWWFRFTAKQTNTNKPPITQRGFKDNLFRVYNWLNRQISNMDTLYNYA